MSDITLTSAVRSNLLSLQNTAELMARTQERLSTGKRVNTALDNPSNFFTASALNSRAGDISALLDSVSNGVQVLKAADTGISGLQKLVDSAKSTARQALQSTNAYSTKAKITGSTALAATADANSLFGVSKVSGTALGAATATARVETGSVAYGTDAAVATAFAGGSKSFSVNGINITIAGGTATQAALTSAINTQLAAAGSLVTVALDGSNNLAFTSSDGGDITFGGADLATVVGTLTDTTAGVFKPVGASAATALGFTAGQTFKVNDQTITVAANDTIDSLAAKVSTATGGNVTASFNATDRKFTFAAKDTLTALKLENGTGNLSRLGLAATDLVAGYGDTAETLLRSKTLSVTLGSVTTTITFGTNAGQVKSLSDLNSLLESTGVEGSIDSTGKLVLTTTNAHGADTFSIAGTASTSVFGAATVNSSAVIFDPTSKASRANLVKDYNDLLGQITKLAQDSSYNGVNLLNGDDLELVFNENGSSKLSIKGVKFDAESLGLASIAEDDFLDSGSINKVLDKLNTATNTLRSQASKFGSNLSIVQTRQEFSKNLINVLQTGASNLTLADLNEEGANYSALSTRQQISTSALALSASAGQQVLQLLR